MKLLVILALVASLAFAADFEYSTTGSMGTAPTQGGASGAWGDWFVTSILNDSGHDIVLTQLSIPCCGPATGDYGWIVWTDVGGLVPPEGPASTADFYGAFTPVDPSPYTNPPTTYTDIDVSAASVLIPSGNYFCVGYDVTSIGGYILFNGVDTWSWFDGKWDSDQSWGYTAVIDVYADYVASLERNSWGSIKTSF